MVLAGRKPSNEVRFCWEQVLRTNRLFRISLVFVPADRARQLLPLYALFGAVEEISSKHSDEDLARRQFDWWREECARLESQGSEHPILRELCDSGAYQAIRKDRLAQLFDDAESRLDPQAPSDMDGLKSLCGNLIQPQFQLELSLSGEKPERVPSLDGLAAVSGLTQLLRESCRSRKPAGYWWLPLSLMARYGVSRADIAHGHRPDAAVQAVFTDLLGSCLDWNAAPESARAGPKQGGAPARHLFVLGELQAAALRRLKPSQPGQFAADLTRLGLPQLYRAWKSARTIAAEV
jgi:phytoene/squalene synthetase